MTQATTPAGAEQMTVAAKSRSKAQSFPLSVSAAVVWLSLMFLVAVFGPSLMPYAITDCP